MRRMYSESELKRLISEHIANSDVIAKSLNIKEPVAVYDFEAYDLAGRTLTDRYSKAILSSGLLLLVFNYVLTNNTGESQSQANMVFTLTLPDEIAEKIICFNGEKLSDPFTESVQVANIGCSYGQYLTTWATRGISKVAKNKLGITIVCPALNTGISEQFTARQWLSLF